MQFETTRRRIRLVLASAAISSASPKTSPSSSILIDAKSMCEAMYGGKHGIEEKALQVVINIRKPSSSLRT